MKDLLDNSRFFQFEIISNLVLFVSTVLEYYSTIVVFVITFLLLNKIFLFELFCSFLY